MTKPKCVDFKICGDLTLATGHLKGTIKMKAVGWGCGTRNHDAGAKILCLTTWRIPSV